MPLLQVFGFRNELTVNQSQLYTVVVECPQNSVSLCRAAELGSLGGTYDDRPHG